MTIVDPSINGPWDSALFDRGSSAKLFVANGLSGAIVRLDLAIGGSGVSLKKATRIASGYGHQCDPVTFVDAPTGLVYNPNTDVLFVASTVDNAVFAVSSAGARTSDGGMGTVIYQDPAQLHGALAMAMAPNGHLLVCNNDAINPDQTNQVKLSSSRRTAHLSTKYQLTKAQVARSGLTWRPSAAWPGLLS